VKPAAVGRLQRHSTGLGMAAGMAWLVWQAVALNGAKSGAAAAADWLRPPPLGLLLALVGALLFYALHASARTLSRLRSRVKGIDQERNRLLRSWRLAALPAFAWIVFQLLYLWWPLADGALAPADGYGHLVRLLSSTFKGMPLVAMGYTLGVAACAVHFGGGLMAFTQRLSQDEIQPQRGVVVAASLVGFVSFVAATGAVMALATGWHPLASASSKPPAAASLCQPGPKASASASPPERRPSGP
jgi:hypothetical protein